MKKSAMEGGAKHGLTHRRKPCGALGPGAPAVADAVLEGRGHLGARGAEALRGKEGVVAEAAGPAGLEDEPPPAAPLEFPLEAAGPAEGEDAHELGEPPSVWNRAHGANELPE